MSGAPNELLTELARITRELHEALDGVRVDPRLSELATHDIPDAREKLGWVLALTEQAAHRVINAVEEGLPVASALESGAVSEPAQVQAEGKRLHALLSDILMAQSFQDLSGQAIRRVIGVAGELERRLAELVARTGGMHRDDRAAGETAAAAVAERPASRLRDQDEVDALLSSMGF
ncbi:protein phosphatase CheZ [Thioalkalivibrio sp. XN279]|uniref:protein phosphatase CheZ n=1 Tax=Thioalkalivibrio sp. XN279 TaxID=2714953 RepID=UPI00140ACC4D|nr:protein phosphatase CheZ [Thioalkalivibrio sp. XN279]NHA13349.1 protein phosphatase CheZ [Thioalkalivibrio sp. XN279]